jgi:hypothetical protein
MFFLCAFIFSFFIYSILQHLPYIKNKNYFFNKKYPLDKWIDNTNISILSDLGYYNININSIKISFISECMNYLLYAHNPNYTEVYNFTFDEMDIDIDIDDIEDLYINFENYCTEIKKYKTDFTIGEITTFIKKSDIYIQIEKDLGLKFKRAIILSKFTNCFTIDKLRDALTPEELTILNM